jgi:hypothetical protein
VCGGQDNRRTRCQHRRSVVVSFDYGLSADLLTRKAENRITSRLLGKSGGEGFEPSSDLTARNGFETDMNTPICRQFASRSPVCSPVPSDPGTDAFAEMTMQLFKREDARGADVGREQWASRLEEQLV